jgi:hypothetical protein
MSNVTIRDIKVWIDGKDRATLTINRDRGWATVRPKGKRTVYRLLLPEVCELIAWRAARKQS